MLRRLRDLTVLLLSLSLALGCGNSKGSLSGSVVLNGEPLEGGQVTAFDAQNNVLGISQIANGNYSFTDLPTGPVTLVVQTYQGDGRPINVPTIKENEKPPPAEIVKERMKDQPENLQKPLKPVPLKYTSVAKSDLKTTVSGSTSYDIQMTGKGEIPHLGTARPKPPGPPGPPMPPR